MIITPPFHLGGENGKALGPVAMPLALLGITDALLRLRSLDVDTLTFSLRNNGIRPAIPDDGQWLSLYDANNQRLFTGIAKRSFEYPARIYRYEVKGPYQGLMETPLIGDDGRPFLLYIADDLGNRLRNLIIRAADAGLPIQAPLGLPPLYLVPKMAFRGTTYAAAIEDCCKWAPDLVTRMDYSTTPPTLLFETRAAATARALDLQADTHKSLSLALTALPEARALSVSFAYARRSGDDVVLYLVQSAGDDKAEASRKLSLYLSGQERSDLLVTEALTTAQKAVAVAQASVAAVGASVDAAAASAQIQLTWAALLPLDATLQAAVAAQSNFSMVPSTGTTYTLYNGISWPPSLPWTGTTSMPTAALRLRTSTGAIVSGWYPIKTGAFTNAQLATAGASKQTLYISGDFIATRDYWQSNNGMSYLESNAPAKTSALTGWTQGSAANSTDANNYFRKYLRYGYNIAVDAINMAPSAVAAAVKAAAEAGNTSLIQRAEFVEAPPDLAQNYFQRQDWTPYKGSVAFAPSVADIPAPGDFINVLGSGIPAEWATMKAPVAETSIDLATRAVTCVIGPSPRQDFQSLIDRLRIPQEDNYEPG